MSFWTDQNTAQLRDLIEVQKSSASQAAAALGCSRNAVIGRAKRCGIAFPRRPVVFGNLALKTEPFEARRIEISTEHQCCLLHLKNESCRYVVTDAAPHVFCGVPEADFSNSIPYCVGHAALCYRPPGGNR